MRLALSTLVMIGGSLAAQTWDVRLEIPFPKGQNLPQTLLTGTGDLVSGRLDTGRGAIVTLSRRLVRVGPVLRLEWHGDYTDLRADGPAHVGMSPQRTDLRQQGFGLGLQAQFWIPFTGLAGEVGLTERFQRYRYEVAGVTVHHDLARPWLRVGTRARLPFPVLHPYLAASYQQPLTKDHPVELGSVADLQALLMAQGKGQAFERLWTFGIGLTF